MIVNSSIARDLDRQLMIRLKESLLDLDILVDDARVETDRAVERFKLAVARRDATARRLMDLINKAA
jgi:hypothetical protein